MVLTGIHLYRTQDMLPTGDEPAPPLILQRLDGSAGGLRDAAGRPALVYFFAPWCKVCAASSHNIRNLRRIRDEEDFAVFLVALAWQNQDEVEDYVERHELDVPVLLGNMRTAEQWGISVFPTYYMLDSDHRVSRRDYGYSTLLGLWARSLLLG